MAHPTLTIDLGAIVANWRALARAAPTAEMGAVVKANGYGLGVAPVARALVRGGARTFFVASAQEGTAVRTALGEGPAIHVFSGHMEGDAEQLASHSLIPHLNSGEQVARHRAALPGHPYAVQLDTGMNRLGMEASDWAAQGSALGDAVLVSSHLACADDPDHEMNRKQLIAFREMTEGIGAPRSLSATGGILLGSDWHFDLCRPGIGLYGGLPFASAQSVVRLEVPVIQLRELTPGEVVGYGAAWTAQRPTRLATLLAGYGDGLIRAMGGRVRVWAEDSPCPVVGRVSMDLLTVDVTDLEDVPETLDILGPRQGIDAVAEAAGTIGYEILTSLGPRYLRRYTGG